MCVAEPVRVPACLPACSCLPLPCSNLKRYLHYLTRFEANLQSSKLEEKLRKVQLRRRLTHVAAALRLWLCSAVAGWSAGRLARHRSLKRQLLSP